MLVAVDGDSVLKEERLSRLVAVADLQGRATGASLLVDHPTVDVQTIVEAAWLHIVR
jgi:hypothetical protein